MLVQVSLTDDEVARPLQVETNQDVALQGSARSLWTGLGLTVLMLIGLSACALHPLASHSSAEASRFLPEAAFTSMAALGPLNRGIQLSRHPGSGGRSRSATLRAAVISGPTERDEQNLFIPGAEQPPQHIVKRVERLEEKDRPLAAKTRERLATRDPTDVFKQMLGARRFAELLQPSAGENSRDWSETEVGEVGMTNNPEADGIEMTVAIEEVRSAGTAQNIYDARAETAEYEALWKSGANDEQAKQTLKSILSRGRLYGRLLVGREGNFQHLHRNTWKRFTFVFGPQTLESFLGRDARGIARILELSDFFIDQEIARGQVFKMALFAVTPGDDYECVPATWDGLEYMVRTYYPEAADKICAQLPTLQTMSFKEIQSISDYDIRMAARKRLFWGRDVAEFDPSLNGVRQWLWDHVGMNEEFTGTGYTKGNYGTPEYFALNRRLDEFPALGLIDLKM